MTTSDAVRAKTLILAEAHTPTEEAVGELMECCGGKRAPVVVARQQFLKDIDANRSDPVVSRAVELLGELLVRLPLG